ncbi:hypothetical protein GQ54DRAFT_296521 [Martensiomyces pterosporus]|nr:hypothetical protein GQ54DRAFT_296521 [Martensiomyces pterosporus]
MSSYGNPNFTQGRGYSHGYGPDNGHSGSASTLYAGHSGRRDENASQQRIQNKSTGSGGVDTHSEQQTGFNQSSAHNQDSDGEDGERGFKDFFHKKPDPNYAGAYGDDYTPEINKSRVIMVGVGAAALLFAAHKLNKRRDKKKRERYNKSYHRGAEGAENTSQDPYQAQAQTKY